MWSQTLSVDGSRYASRLKYVCWVSMRAVGRENVLDDGRKYDYERG